MPPVPALLWTRATRTMPGILLAAMALALGPLLGLFLDQAPILDSDRDLIAPWLALVATASTSMAVWGLQGLSFARRTQARPLLTDTLAATGMVLATLVLAAGSLILSGFHVHLSHIPMEALRMGSLAALLVTLWPGAPRLAPALVWIPAWLVPAAVPVAPLKVLSPFQTTPTVSLTATAGLLLLALASSPHALRDPR